MGTTHFGNPVDGARTQAESETELKPGFWCQQPGAVSVVENIASQE